MGSYLAIVMRNYSFYVYSTIVCQCGVLFAAEKTASIPQVTQEELLQSTEQWIQIELLIGKESKQWKLEKERMAQLIVLYQEELKFLRDELDAAGQSVSAFATDKKTLESQVADSETSRAKVSAFITQLKPRMIALYDRFPVPLKEKLSDEILILKEKEATSSTSLRSILSVLNEANQFNNQFKLVKQEIEIDTGTRFAQVLYVGLGRAFFLVNDQAGVGLPDASLEDGWTWKKDTTITEEVKKAFAVLEQSSPPTLVKLPIQLAP